MKIAITGGSGFIGMATTAAARAAGHETVAWFDKPAHDILGDLSGLGGAECVIHLAGVLGTAELFDAAEEAIRVNAIGTLRILEWCAQNRARYVGITMPPVFPSVYTATKMCADRLATAWHRAKGVPVSRVRAFNAYGPYQKHGTGHPQKIIPTFATEAWAGRPIPIWGDGKQTVDLVHVDDLGKMLVDAMAFGDDETFDGGTGWPLSVLQVAEYVLQVTGSTAGVTHLPMRLGETSTQICATREGWGKLARTPKHSWDRLEETVRWYKPQ